MSRRNVNIDIPVGRPSNPKAHPSGIVYPPINPIGGSDLFPGPGAGIYPTRGDFGEGSMHVGPNDPRWFGGVGENPGFPGEQPGVPPGARFDPYGPPGVPGFEPYRYVRAPRRPGSGTHPDLEYYRSDSEDVLGYRPLGYWRNFRAPRRPGSGTHPDREHFGYGFEPFGYWRNFWYVRIVAFAHDN